MAAAGHRRLWFLLVPLFLVVVLVFACGWGIWSFVGRVRSLLTAPGFWEPTPVVYDTPTELARVAMPRRPDSLTWSPDGAYLAAGTWGPGPSDVFIVDAARASVTATLQATGLVQALAFSPDGKWLAVATRQTTPAGPAPPELVVFAVPAFTARLTARSSLGEGFTVLAWAADGSALCAIEDSPVTGPGTYRAAARGWAVPAFAELPAIRAPRDVGYEAYESLAVSPDGRTVAVAEERDPGVRVVRLFDLGSGNERSSFQTEYRCERMGFTPDGKAVGVFRGDRLWYWDATTGKPADPKGKRPALPQVGLSSVLAPASAVSPDGRLQAEGDSRYPRLVGEDWGQPTNKYGAFVVVTDLAAEKTWTWRLGGTTGSDDAPTVAFSPDGAKLAGAATEYDDLHAAKGTWVWIWAVPK